MSPPRKAIEQLDCGVLLLVYSGGRDKVGSYLRAAKVLRQSLKFHSPNIPCALATDQYKKQHLKQHFDYIVPIKNARPHYLEKVYINTYSPFKHTLYLDSNSLVLKDISKIFDLFKGNPFTRSSGNLKSIDDPTLPLAPKKIDLQACMKYYQITHIRLAHGGLYYFERGSKADAFFKQAQKIANNVDCPIYDYDDEIIYAIAEQLTQAVVVYDDKSIMRTCSNLADENIFALRGGSATFKKVDGNPIVLVIASRTFQSFNLRQLVYLREKLKLRFNKNIVDFLYNSKLIVLFMPWMKITTHYLKQILKLVLGKKLSQILKNKMKN